MILSRTVGKCTEIFIAFKCHHSNFEWLMMVFVPLETLPSGTEHFIVEAREPSRPLDEPGNILHLYQSYISDLRS
jgi:hypothetical protein